MDEMFEALTLIQTGKIKHFPVVLFGTKYWKGLLDWLRDTMAAERKVNARDLELFSITDDPHEALHSLNTARQQLLTLANETRREVQGNYGVF